MLCITFLFLAIDESSVIHELANTAMQKLNINLEGVFFYAWIIPGTLFVILFGLSYLKFFLSLPKEFKYRFTLSAIIFLSGAIVMEAVCSYCDSQNGAYNLGYSILANIEESLKNH